MTHGNMPRSGPIEFATFDRYMCILQRFDSTDPDPVSRLLFLYYLIAEFFFHLD